MDPIINRTGRAVTALAVLVFCLGTIAWLILNGSPTNSLHQSALSWSYTIILVTMAALGLNVTAETVAKLLTAKK
jgi:hypothetical protein